MNSSFKIQSPSPHPMVGLIHISLIIFIIFFAKPISSALLIPLIVYFIFKYKVSLEKFLVLSLIVFIIFLFINFLLTKNINLALLTTFHQALRWCILLFMGLFFDRFISTSSVIYLFYKARLFNLSIPFMVAARFIPKFKYDIETGNKAAIIRGLHGRTPRHIFLRLNSIIFMLLSSAVIFLLEFGTLLKIRGVDFPQKKILNRFQIKSIDLIIIFCLAIIILSDNLFFK